MNYLSHHEVARRLAGDTDDPAFMFGAMSPDFFGMFHVRKAFIENQSLLVGLALHQATDIAFDRQEAIKELEADMIGSFKTFMPRWSAVQSGKVGKDILFDGVLFEDELALNSYRQTMHAAAIGELDIRTIAEPAEQWLDGVRALEATGLPRYDDPRVVAERIQRRLHGTRTAFEISLVPQLAASLAVHQRRVMEIGHTTLSNVVSELSLIF
jgi:hypothetical protein